jgi:photosystem II stability/assembly factor-like uncharacterized protein
MRASVGLVCVTLAPVALCAATAGAQRPASTGREAAAPMLTGQVAFDTTAFAGLRWREIGPYRGGRSVAVMGSVARPKEYWMGTTGGGVFKSTDGGTTWEPMSDRYFGGTIGAIAVDESNPDVVYVGGGETPIRGNVSNGDGLWKTTDGGKTWTKLPIGNTGQTARILIHPTNANRVYLAALGDVWKPTRERGLYRSDDAGKSWKQILFRDDSTGAIDLVMDPSNPNTLYAAFWQAGRTSWSLSSGGKGSGIFKSTDGGDHWTEITRNPGLPKGVLGKIGITVSPANPQRLWALIEADSGGVYRSDDGGATWTLTNDDRSLRQRAWYYTVVRADPKDANSVYALNVGFFRSTDGGKTFKSVDTPHSDNHDLWIAPNDPQRMIEGNDGGANVSENGGKTWTEQDFATAQFYHVSTTNEFPYRICGAQQDNSTLCGPSRWPGGITMADWYDAGGGESGYVTPDPRDPDIVYAGSYGGLLTKKDRETGLELNVSPWPLNPMGKSSEDIKYRFQWTYPIVFSRHDSTALYAGGSQLFKSTNGGRSWTIVSPPLARNDPRTMGPSGGPITKDQTGVETYGVIFAFDESPVTAGVFWAGSDDGLIHVSRDGSKSWQNVTPPASLLPEFARISIIEPSPYDAGTAYVAANRYQMGDERPYLLKTADYGKTWTRIDTGIPAGQFTRVVRADPVRRGLLYAGTERGVWVSFNDGASWQSLQRDLPPVPVHDLTIKEGDLIAATHGRSFYVMDDLSALRQLTPQVVAQRAHLFQPRDAYRVQWGRGFGGGDGGGTVGANPPGGPTVYYWLKQPGQKVALEFLDASGKVIHRYESAPERDTTRRARAGVSSASPDAPAAAPSEQAAQPTPRRGGGREASVPNKAGLNQFTWDMRYPDAVGFQGLIMWAGRLTGPIAPPGTYQVRLTVGDAAPQTQRFALLKDPRTEATQGDLVAQFNMLIAIRDRLSDANNAVRTIRNVKFQLDDREKTISGGDSTRYASLADSLATAISTVEEALYQVKNRSGQDPLNYPIRLNNEIAALAGHVGSGEMAPTAQAKEVFALLSQRLDAQLDTLKRTMDDMLPRVNAILRQAGKAPIVPSTEEVGRPPNNVAMDDDTELEADHVNW